MAGKLSKFNAGADTGHNRDWFFRSNYWETYRRPVIGRPKKFVYREPLILCGYAAHIRVDHGSLLIRNGFTHYPQKQEITRLFPGDPNLPNRIVMIDGSGGLTFDALNWISEQQIEFVRLNWRGEIANIAGWSGYSGNSRLIQAQNKMRSTRGEIQFARDLIAEKIKSSIQTLKLVIPNSENRELAISRLGQKYSEIRNSKKKIAISTLLGAEGVCAGAYFRAWHNLPIKWVGFKRKPIPDNWFEISPRTMAWRKRAYNARHPVNAMLNYGYGILANEMRGQVIAAGLDPTIGIIHGNSANRIPLVYDLMEPLRPVVDRAILKFALTHTFSPGDFAINRFGACRINPQMAKRLVEGISFEENQVRSLVQEFLSRLTR